MGRRSSDSDSSHVRNRKSKTRRRSRSKSNSDSSSSSESSSRRRRSRNDQKSSRKSPERSRATRGRRSRSRDKSDRTTSAMPTKTIKQEKTIPHTQVSMSSLKFQELRIKTPGEQLKDKVQRAIHAAAIIDSELKKASLASNKGWGRSTTDTQPVPSTATVASDSKLPVMTVQEQTARVDALQAINAPGFQQQSFTSRSEDRAVSLKSQDGHAALVDLASIALPQPVKANVAHDKLFLDPKVKQEQWIMKLFHMRQKKLNGEAMN